MSGKESLDKVEYQCPKCGTQLVNPRIFVDYGCPNDDCDKNLIPRARAEPLTNTCDLCGKGFETERGLKSHKGQVHEKCEECGRWFKNKRALSAHKRQAH